MSTLDDLRRLYLAWRDAQRTRSSRGELRASADEREALERFVIAEAECAERDAWNALRADLDLDAELDANEEFCACRHPASHHDVNGSCFHVVGCATACDCRSGCIERPS